MTKSDETERWFSYRVRALILGAVVAVAVWGASRLPDDKTVDDIVPWSPHVGLWISLALAAVILLPSLVRKLHHLSPVPGPDSPRWAGVVRWVWLALAVAAVLQLAEPASMPDGSPAIVRIELGAQAPDSSYFDQLRTSIEGDWWFIPAYVALLAVLVVWSGPYFRLGFLRRLAKPVAYAVVVAGALDVVEDAMMLWGTHDSRNLPWQLAATAGWPKFALLLAATGYVLGGAHSWLATPPWVRRQAWALTGTPESVKPTEVDETDRQLGIALSGGGIRAASITLGALQCLELDRRAPQDGGLGWGAAQMVTAISGGSNMAAGWSIARSTYRFVERPGGAKAGCSERVPPETMDPQPWAYYKNDGTNHDDLTPEEQHLFNNLGYLASTNPRGASDDPASVPDDSTPHAETVVKKQASRPNAYATVFAGLAVNAGVLLGALFVLSRPAGWAMQGLTGEVLPEGGIHDFVSDHRLGVVGPTFLGIGAVLLMMWVLVGQLFSTRVGQPNDGLGAFQGQLLGMLRWATYGALLLGVALTLVLWVLPELAGFAAKVSLTGSSLTSLAAAGGVIGAVVRILRNPVTTKYAPLIGGIAFGLLLTFLAALWMGTAATTPVTQSWSTWNSLWRWLAICAALIFLQVFVSPEKWSLAAFYRGKLRLAYASYRRKQPNGAELLEVYRNDTATSEKAEREPYLHTFTKRSGTPVDGVAETPLVICATATVTSRAVRTHHGIPALSVTFDPDSMTVHVPHNDRGKWGEYKASTRLINALGEKHGKRLTTMLAAAVSSAAVSPAMGRFRVGPTSMLLAFANLRLGVWLPNPRFAAVLDDGAKKPSFPRTGLGYLVKEFLGIHDLTDPYLYITDGGHWENTGLVEILRSSAIREVVCVDADAGPGDALSSLGKALELAPMECDVKIWIDLDCMRAKNAPSVHSPGYADRTVNLGFFTRGRDVSTSGLVWYSKPGLTAAMPQHLLAFRETHADFPHVSTVDQFFDTASFQAYRDLGRYNAREILFARSSLVALLADLSGMTDPEVIDSFLTGRAARPGAHWVIGEFHRALGRRQEQDWGRFISTIAGVLSEH